ncbi:hypothetical protein BMS3Abin03_01514 [bacterium BMS3Abin03]|nr:hypothetical protein BMS3Abin03_01514 [bacterium BMS3Abin03]
MAQMDEKKTAQLFMQLVIQNQQMAMIALGKIKNPVTDKTDKNIEFAKLSIDILDMLLIKTKGNLLEYEEKFLTETLNQLKITYAQEVDKTGSETTGGENKE